MTKVAINGFGRIGRLVFRGLLDRTDLDIVAINNPSGPETAAYLLKYDTVHGRLNKKVEIDKDDLIVDGKRIHVFQDRFCALSACRKHIPHLCDRDQGIFFQMFSDLFFRSLHIRGQRIHFIIYFYNLFFF